MILICGIPNSGKTTYSLLFKDVIHLDEVEPVDGSYPNGVLKLVSESDGEICVEGIYLIKSMRKKLLAAYHGHEKKTCIWLNIPLEECLKRENRNRPLFFVQNCYDIFEPPTYDEGWDEIIEIRDVLYIEGISDVKEESK